jgi:hypothetical protein
MESNDLHMTAYYSLHELGLDACGVFSYSHCSSIVMSLMLLIINSLFKLFTNFVVRCWDGFKLHVNFYVHDALYIWTHKQYTITERRVQLYSHGSYMTFYDSVYMNLLNLCHLFVGNCSSTNCIFLCG